MHTTLLYGAHIDTCHGRKYIEIRNESIQLFREVWRVKEEREAQEKVAEQRNNGAVRTR